MNFLTEINENKHFALKFKYDLRNNLSRRLILLMRTQFMLNQHRMTHSLGISHSIDLGSLKIFEKRQ